MDNILYKLFEIFCFYSYSNIGRFCSMNNITIKIINNKFGFYEYRYLLLSFSIDIQKKFNNTFNNKLLF